MRSPRNGRHRLRFGCAIGEHLRCCQRANVPSGATCRQTKIFVRPLNCRFLLDSQPWSTSAILGPSPDRRGCALTRRVYADSISEESSSHSSSSLVRDARKSGERRAKSVNGSEAARSPSLSRHGRSATQWRWRKRYACYIGCADSTCVSHCAYGSPLNLCRRWEEERKNIWPRSRSGLRWLQVPAFLGCVADGCARWSVRFRALWRCRVSTSLERGSEGTQPRAR